MFSTDLPLHILAFSILPYGLKHEAILNKNNVFIIKLVVLTASLLVHDLLLCAGNEEQDDIHIQLPFIKGENLLVS